MLCFISDKCPTLAVDDLVKICIDFYTESETIDARDVIESLSARIRHPRRKSSDRLRHMVEDIVKFVLNNTKELPEFHAKNLARLPTLDATPCDVSAILAELRALHLEVRNTGQINPLVPPAPN